MEGDRRAALILRAHCAGKIDLAGADLADRRWWARLGAVLNQVEADGLLELLKLRAQQQAAALSACGPENCNKHWEALDRAIAGCARILRPWDDHLRDETGERDRAAANWKAHWGDTNDPRVQQAIEQTARYLEANTAR